MIIDTIVEVPADRRVFLELPCSVPSGVKARISVSIPAMAAKNGDNSEIENVRQLLQKEMAEKGTLDVRAESGAGWEAHVKERYAQS